MSVIIADHRVGGAAAASRRQCWASKHDDTTADRAHRHRHSPDGSFGRISPRGKIWPDGPGLSPRHGQAEFIATDEALAETEVVDGDVRSQRSGAARSRRPISAVKGGRLVVLPTDTVYGLGADAFGAARLSPRCWPLGAGVAKHAGPVYWWVPGRRSTAWSIPCRRRLRDHEAFWPGRWSLVVQAPSLQWDLGDAGSGVMLRMPLHPVAIELLREVGPMAVSSANVSGRPAATPTARGQLGRRRGVSRRRPRPSRPPRPSSTSPRATPRILREGPISDRMSPDRRRRKSRRRSGVPDRRGAVTVVTDAGRLLAQIDRGTGVPLRELVLVGLTAAIIPHFATGWGAGRWRSGFGAVAYHPERDVHVQPVPRMGGTRHRTSGG